MNLSSTKVWLARFWRQTAKPMLIFVLIMTAFRSAIADWNDVPTGSMKPTIVEGDRVFVNKLAYDLKVPYTTLRLAQWSKPKRGDIVVFYSPVDGTRLVKRVVGLPGDIIELANEQLIINGQRATYEPLPDKIANTIPQPERAGLVFAIEGLKGDLSHPVMIMPSMPARRTFSPVTMPADSYFMMGDNRDNSADSRFFGPVLRDRIVGKATTVVMSLDRQHFFTPRWTRFFSRLN